MATLEEERVGKIQARVERAVAYWIDRLVANGETFVGSEHEERFRPLSSLLAELLEGVVGASAGEEALVKAEAVAGQIEAYALGTEGIRARARSAYDDVVGRRDQESAPLARFQGRFEALMTKLHRIDTSSTEDLGADLLQARSDLLELEGVARVG